MVFVDHDFDKLTKKTNMDFLEFHLSYKDLELDISQYLDQEYDLNLVVHSPDLFQGDHYNERGLYAGQSNILRVTS